METEEKYPIPDGAIRIAECYCSFSCPHFEYKDSCIASCRVLGDLAYYDGFHSKCGEEKSIYDPCLG
jgi:hypothetical protein